MGDEIVDHSRVTILDEFMAVVVVAETDACFIAFLSDCIKVFCHDLKLGLIVKLL